MIYSDYSTFYGYISKFLPQSFTHLSSSIIVDVEEDLKVIETLVDKIMPTNYYFSYETIEITSVAFLSTTVSAYENYEPTFVYTSDVYYQPEMKSIKVLKSKNVKIPIELSCSLSGSTSITYR